MADCLDHGCSLLACEVQNTCPSVEEGLRGAPLPEQRLLGKKPWAGSWVWGPGSVGKVGTEMALGGGTELHLMVGGIEPWAGLPLEVEG